MCGEIPRCARDDRRGGEGMTGRVEGAGLAMTDREGMSSSLLYLSYIVLTQVDQGDFISNFATINDHNEGEA